MGVLVVSGCTSNGGRALHVAVISDKKKGDCQHPLAHRPVHVRLGDFASKRRFFFFAISPWKMRWKEAHVGESRPSLWLPSPLSSSTRLCW